MDGTRIHLNGENLCAPPPKDLHLRHDPRRDPVADPVDEPFLEIERLRNAANMTASVLHAHDQRSAGRIGECHDRPEGAGRRGKARLNSSVFPSGRSRISTRSMTSEVYSEAGCRIKPWSRLLERTCVARTRATPRRRPSTWASASGSPPRRSPRSRPEDPPRHQYALGTNADRNCNRRGTSCPVDTRSLMGVMPLPSAS